VIERRAKHRANTTQSGCAAFPKAAAEVPCAVLNFSSQGACVAFAPGTAVPRFFDLRISRDPKLQAVRVVWQRANMVGVTFLAPKADVPDVIHG